MGILRQSRLAAFNNTTAMWIQPAAAFLLDTYPNAAVAYSFRKLRAAYAGSAVRIRESGGQTEADIGFDGSGNFDTAAAAAHIGANSGFIVTWYDQSGNGDNVTQATAANQPAYVASGIASLPSMSFDSTDVLSTATDAVTHGSALFSTYITLLVPSVLDDKRIAGFIGTGQTQDYDNIESCRMPYAYQDPGDATQDFRTYRSGTLNSLKNSPANTELIVGTIWNGSQVTLYLNNSAGSSGAASEAFGASGTINIGGGFTGKMSEFVSWISAQNPTNIDTAINSYYGIH